MKRTLFTPEELVELARVAPRLLEIVDAAKLLAGAAIDFVYDRVMERMAEDRPVLYVYPAAYKPDKGGYAGGEAGTATLEAPFPLQIIDFMLVAKAAGFVIDQFYIGDQNMLLGAYQVPADCYFPQVIARGVRLIMMKRGQTSTVHFRNVTDDPKPLPFMVAAKVRSEFLPDAFKPTDGPPEADAPDDAPISS